MGLQCLEFFTAWIIRITRIPVRSCRQQNGHFRTRLLLVPSSKYKTDLATRQVGVRHRGECAPKAILFLLQPMLVFIIESSTAADSLTSAGLIFATAGQPT
jgi:hypothetical protein